MSKTLKLIVTIMILLVCVCVCTSNSVNAANPNILDGKITDPADENDEIKGKLNTVLGVIQVAGTLFAVGTLMVLGIKYMMGSIEEKAQYKKSMLPYVIGAVFVFSAVNIATVVYKMAQSI